MVARSGTGILETLHIKRTCKESNPIKSTMIISRKYRKEAKQCRTKFQEVVTFISSNSMSGSDKTTIISVVLDL